MQTRIDPFGRWRLVDWRGARYELEDIEVIDEGEDAAMGVCLKAGRFRLEGEAQWWTDGDFRIDTAQAIEPAHEQMELAA